MSKGTTLVVPISADFLMLESAPDFKEAAWRHD
jgi:hypothetical protein